MKKIWIPVLVFGLLVAAGAEAAFVSGSTGADGAFSPVVNTILQLPPDGVFNYTTVNIPAGITVTFTKNAANTPVSILATGDVTISGAIKVDGQSVTYSTPLSTVPGAGGAGGYSGGYGGALNTPGGKGVGPGGGGGGPSANYPNGGGGGYGTAGTTFGTGYGVGGPSYGSARLLPLMGGSGGGGNSGTTTASNYGGAGGGGAILIASSTTIAINGSITADGGNGYTNSGSGSGGAIRLIANTVSGAGNISAKGGAGFSYGGQGRIRIEATTNNFTPGTNPQYTYGQPGSAFPANVPSLSISSISGVSAPATPSGSFAQPDILLPNTTTNPVAVSVSASNIPTGTTVAVTVTPQFGNATSANTTLNGTNASSSASANVTLSTQYANLITAQATFTLLASLYYQNEKIAKVRVAATMGAGSEAVYITESGKEIQAEKLIMAGLIQ